jgi:hypothetical protein
MSRRHTRRARRNRAIFALGARGLIDEDAAKAGVDAIIAADMLAFPAPRQSAPAQRMKYPWCGVARPTVLN